MRVQNSPLCYREIRAVSVWEIEAAELLVMEGLNYQFRCYHASSSIQTLLSDLSDPFDQRHETAVILARVTVVATTALPEHPLTTTVRTIACGRTRSR